MYLFFFFKLNVPNSQDMSLSGAKMIIMQETGIWVKRICS